MRSISVQTSLNLCTTSQDQLYQYLKTLCDLLYDDLRLHIVHEPRLTVLCEVWTVLQALMVLDASVSHSLTSTDNEDDDEDEDSSDEGSSDDADNHLNSDEKSNGKLGRRLQISRLLTAVRRT